MALRCLRLENLVPLLCCSMLLWSVAMVHADPKPLTKEEQAKVDKAIEKGVSYLKRIQREKGDWPLYMRSGYALGQTLLPAYALLESGVPSEDPVIKKAAEYIRPRILKTDRTYEVALGLMFLDRLGDEKDKPLIQSLALRLIAGQHVTGGWNYRCPSIGKPQEETLYKALEELNKGLAAREKSWAELVKGLNLPRALQALVVFRDPRKLTWRDPPGTKENSNQTLFVGATDNSNTQFAILGLWAARRHGIPLGPTFRLMADRFEKTQVANGWWTYTLDPKGDIAWVKRFPSMICVGLLGMAVGRGLKLPAASATQVKAADLHVLKGLAALNQDLGVAAGGKEDPYTFRGAYYLWSVERVAMLYDLPTIGDKDWYRWGAGIIVTSQKPGGEWPKVFVNGKDSVPPGGVERPVIVTSFALLFLKRSHPMKELTPMLPYRAKELNQGIMRLIPGNAPLERSTDVPSRRPASKR